MNRAAWLAFVGSPALASMLLAAMPIAAAGDLPEGFVYLREIAPDVLQDMRYAATSNFTGAKVPGYSAAECVLAKPVAEALAKVQRALKTENKSLVVHDCYRPASAVRHFVNWAEAGGNQTDPNWNPRVPRSQLIEQGYIAVRSGHSTGGSVDMSFAELAASGEMKIADMGSSFDLFDPLSHTDSPNVPQTARDNRAFLVRTMKRQGFANYAREWWHFKFVDAPFAGRQFDFAITASW